MQYTEKTPADTETLRQAIGRLAAADGCALLIVPSSRSGVGVPDIVVAFPKAAGAATPLAVLQQGDAAKKQFFYDTMFGKACPSENAKPFEYEDIYAGYHHEILVCPAGHEMHDGVCWAPVNPLARKY